MPGFLWPLIVYALVLALHLAIPVRWTDGYVKDASGAPLRYRLNGLYVFVAVVALWAAACFEGLLPWDLFYTQRWEMAAGACAVGLVFTFAVVLPAPPVKGFLADVFLGRLENPQWLGGRVDAKMYLYLVGAILLELNVLSFAAAHLQLHRADPSPRGYVPDGFSLALDFPVTRRNASRLVGLCRAFDALLLECGGRAYKAKDCVGSVERLAGARGGRP